MANDPQHAKTILDAFVDAISDDKLDSYVLLSVRGFEFVTKLHESDGFRRVPSASSDQLSKLNVLTNYRGIPVIEIWGVGPREVPSAICAPIRELGIWRQYWASTSGEELAIEISAVSAATAEALLTQHPRLKQDSTGQPYSETQAVTRIRKKVIVKIWERFSYAPTKAKLAIKIVLRGSSQDLESR
jgi:hypothetical protein